MSWSSGLLNAARPSHGVKDYCRAYEYHPTYLEVVVVVGIGGMTCASCVGRGNARCARCRACRMRR